MSHIAHHWINKPGARKKGVELLQENTTFLRRQKVRCCVHVQKKGTENTTTVILIFCDNYKHNEGALKTWVGLMSSLFHIVLNLSLTCTYFAILLPTLLKYYALSNVALKPVARGIINLYLLSSYKNVRLIWVKWASCSSWVTLLTSCSGCCRNLVYCSHPNCSATQIKL